MAKKIFLALVAAGLLAGCRSANSTGGTGAGSDGSTWASSPNSSGQGGAAMTDIDSLNSGAGNH